MTVTPGGCRRVHVLTVLESGKTTAAKATGALGIAPCPLRRLRARKRDRRAQP